MGYFAFVSKWKLEQSDVALMMIIQLQHGLSPEQILQFNKMLEKYPEQQKSYVNFVNEINKNVQNLDSIFNKLSPEKDKLSILKKRKTESEVS